MQERKAELRECTFLISASVLSWPFSKPRIVYGFSCTLKSVIFVDLHLDVIEICSQSPPSTH